MNTTLNRSSWPPGTGEMAERIRAHNWATTPLDPAKTRPKNLKISLDMMLARDR
jgi:hypothetical protein